MKKKLLTMLWTSVLTIASIATPMLTIANGYGNQRPSVIGVPGWQTWWQGSEWFLDFVQNWVNWILALLGMITIIILIYGGFLMVTAAGDDGKYKKGFTIVKQAVIGLILIGVSALIVNLIFHFVNTNSTTASWWTSW